ncbi:hypothetical protein LSCM1_05770 [Leishmania martiniquensis]|uniref:Uncharacterized protein n=1 Tax=Leishmania martiniquensis TaxID=1580590 RepID=A0A836HDD4_9TRYP|nr:hypothetical protein LSCM1_05770 [Leishmania martiniquensis]
MPSGTAPLSSIQVKLDGAAKLTGRPLSSSQSHASSPSEAGIQSGQVPRHVCDGSNAGAVFGTHCLEPVSGVRGSRSELTSALSSVDATMDRCLKPSQSLVQPSSSAPHSGSLSWRKVGTTTAVPPTPTTMKVFNPSFFSKKASAAPAQATAATSAAEAMPLKTFALTARMSSQSPTQRAVATPAAAAAVALSSKVRLSRRRDSAWARTSVLAQARHRRLLPLIGTEKRRHEEECDGAVIPTACSTQESPLARTTSLSSETQGNMSGGVATPDTPLRQCSYRSSFQPLAALSSQLSCNAAAAAASARGSGAAAGGFAVGARQQSRGSQVSEAAAPPQEGETALSSLTSLQQRLWGRTGGMCPVAPITTEHDIDDPEPRLVCERQTRSTVMPLLPTRRLRASAGVSTESCKVRPEAATAGRFALAPTVAQWKLLLDIERAHGERGKHIAHMLIERLLGLTATVGPFSNRHPGGSAFDRLYELCQDTHSDEDGSGPSGGGHLRPLCERAAVGAYLLSSLLDGLPRHQQSLSPYIHMLLDFTFVTDTPTNRAILGGCVQDGGILRALEMMREGSGGDGEKAEKTSPLPPGVMGCGPTSQKSGEAHHGSRPFSLTGGRRSIGEGLYELLYPNFTRVTYVAAHYDAAQATVALAHYVRSRELHQLSVPRLLAYTHRNWMRWLMRAVLRAWQHLCRERRVQEQRQRARWAERWTGERVRINLRRWRGYAALTLQIAEADSLAKALLAEKRACIERLEKESASMQACSALLQHTLHRQEETRDSIEGVIVQREQVYKKLLRQVREMDRVGSLMLRSLLLPDAPPVPDEEDVFNGLPAAANSASSFGDQRSSVMSLSVSTVDLRSLAVTPPFSTDSGELNVWQPPHALVALPTLLRWAKACVAKVQAEYVSFFPEEDGIDDAAAAAEGSARDVTTQERPKEEEDMMEGNASPRGSSVASALTRPQAKLDGNPLAASPMIAALSSRASSSDGFSSRSREPTRSRFIGLEVLLAPTAAEVPASTTRSSSASDTVLVPLHLLLLLMRGCSGAQGSSGVVGYGGKEVCGKTAITLVTASGAAVASLADGDGVSSATCPSWDLVRAVELTDRVVLNECHALLRKDAMALTGSDARDTNTTMSSAARGQRPSPTLSTSDDNKSTPTSVSATGVSIMYRLTSATREKLRQVCRVVVDSYEQLTGTACVVTADRLFERSRGTLLVLIAALMRYYTNWATHCSQQLAPISIKRKCAAPLASTAAAHEGTKHMTYEEWSHPPHSHRGWLAQVRFQAQWIALSFSALHEAVLMATHPPDVLSMLEQERVAGLLQRISLTELTGLLCWSPERTMQSFVDMIGVVERYAPSLRLLFHRYALPLAQLRAGGEGAKGSPTQGGDAYITGNTVWGLLCLTGLAGQAPRSSGAPSKRGVSSVPVSAAVSSQPLSATLHRPAVYSLIEHVAHGVLAANGVQQQQQRASMRGRSNFTTSPTATGPPSLSDGTYSPRRTKPTHVVSVSCRGRPIPCYARALRDDRHVDLRADAGAVCVDFVQFVKLIIRLAHAWQCQQLQQQLLMAEEEAPRHAETGEEGGRRATRSLTDVSAGTPLAGVARSSRSSSVAHSASSQQQRCPSRATEKSASCDHVQYEGVDYASPLYPAYFDTFLGRLLLPRLLGANRWISAAQRAFLRKPVLALLAQNHDALLTVFKTYQRPSECRGVRGALPPPFSSLSEPRTSTRIVKAEQHTSVSVMAGHEGGWSHGESASLVSPATDRNSRQGSTAAGRLPIALDPNQRRLPSRSSHSGPAPGARDVGIVSILRWTDVQAMAKDLEWFRETRLSEVELRHCFDHVVADGAREGEVLFFAEFLRLLCAIAGYARPDPTVPLEVKLDSFLQTRVLGMLE